MSTWNDLKDNPRLQKIYHLRLEIERLTREFFWTQNFVEASTPIALRLAGQEPYLNPVPVKVGDPLNKEYQFYLRTSPEFALKKLLATGLKKIFEIGKCFRNYESFGGTHNTEFTMIEWYQSPGTYWDFMQDTENLFKYIGKKLAIDKLRYRGKEIDFLDRWDRASVKELWQKYIGVNLDDYLEIDNLKTLAKKRGYQVDGRDEYEDLFYKIFLNEIENHLGQDRPIFIYDYPTSMCSLSLRCEDKRYAQRAELYIGGLEVANGFGELLDPIEQKKNLEKDKALRSKLGRETWEVDPDFIAALEAGIKPSGGIALGVDRMVLLFTGALDINEVIFQSISDQLN
jgi:lysyl-tRNA synthetase class 2